MLTCEIALTSHHALTQVLGRAYGCPEELNDDDLEAELDALGDLDFDMESDLLPDMPDAATAEFGGPAAVAAPAQPAGQVPVDDESACAVIRGKPLSLRCPWPT
eukprot:gene19278-20460_t